MTEDGGRGLGLVGEHFLADLWVYLGYTPVCFLAGGLPIGAMELTFAELFADAARLGTREQALSLSLVGVRVVQLVWALPGALVVLQSKRAPAAEEQVEKVEKPGDTVTAISLNSNRE